MDNARLLFTLFSPAQIRDMVDLAFERGHALANDVHSGSGSKWDLPHLFAYADPEVVPAEDIPALLNGIALILASAMRTPLGNDQYEDLLITTFNMPESMAAKFAKNIETEDANYGSEDSWAYKIYASVAGMLRKTANWVADIFQTGWEIDQDQDNDTDFLFELIQLGRVAVDAKTAIQMTKAKAYIDNMTGFIGSTTEAGDPASDDQLLNLASSLRSFLLRPLPVTVLGSWYAPLSAARKKTAEAMTAVGSKNDLLGKLEQLKTLIDPTTPDGKANLARLSFLVPGLSTVVTSMIRRNEIKKAAAASGLTSSMADRLKARGDVAEKLETGGPLYDFAKSIFKKVTKNKSSVPVTTGDEDIDNALDYAYQTGDINPLAEQIIGEIANVPDEHVSDSELGDAVAEAVDAYGDVMDDDAAVEMGGLISRWRKTRAAKKVAKGQRRITRKKRRAKRRDERQFSRATAKRARQMGRGQDYDQGYDPNLMESQFQDIEAGTGTEFDQRDFDVPGASDYYPEEGYDQGYDYGYDEY